MIKRLLRPAACAVLIVGIGAGIWWGTHAKRPETAEPGRAVAPKPESRAGEKRTGTAAPSAATANQPAMATENLLQRLAANLGDHRTEKGRSEMAGLHGQLQKLSRGEAVRQLLAFGFGGGRRHGLALRGGAGRAADQAPTLRVAALDWLGEFDPAAAADMARQIFTSSGSADEWALALRNYYRQNQSADAYF